jgi:hypothetical protein
VSRPGTRWYPASGTVNPACVLLVTVPPVLKISILSADALLLNGEPTDLDRLDHALAEAKAAGGLVYYYRENPPADPSAGAMEVLKLVVKHQLPVTLSTQPDFSDYVDANGVPHPRREAAAAPALRMPEVEPRPDIDAVFAQVRQTASRGNPRGIAVLTPERQLALVPMLPDTPAVKTMAANLAKLVPAAARRNIVGIGYTAPSSLSQPNDPNQSAPFFALLAGLCHVGHLVWVFEGHASALEAGCREGDVLIVDSGVRHLLPDGWQDTVAAVMRNANILVFNRTNAKLGVVKQVGARSDQLEFSA